MNKLAAVFMVFCSLFCLSIMPVQSADTGRKTKYTDKEIALRTSFEKLVSQCLTRQRMLSAIIIYGPGDPAKPQAQLTETLDSIGSIFKTYYGEQNGGPITALFKQYIQLSVDYTNTVKVHGDTAALTNTMHSKADQIAGLLNSGKKAKKNARLAGLLKKYSDSVIAEIDMQGAGNRMPDSAAYGASFSAGMEMADALATRIVRQNPEQFKQE